jgi:uroporphyrinogen decarboxylase
MTRRDFARNASAAALALNAARRPRAAQSRSKRDLMLALLDMSAKPNYVPAGFFMHFGVRGDAAVKAHLDYFRGTGMDFVKIQFDEQTLPPDDRIKTPADWARLPILPEKWWEPSLYLMKALIKEAKSQALVIQTLYSPYQMAKQAVPWQTLVEHVRQDAEAVSRGMENITLSLMNFVQAGARLGVDGYYMCSQGGETNRIADRTLFNRAVKAYDMMLYKEVSQLTAFNIMHLCDFEGSYTDFVPRFRDYPGHVVNVPLSAEGKPFPLRQAAEIFRRPVMGGVDRLGIITTGTPEQAKNAALNALKDAPPNYILSADCTVAATTPIENLRTAIRTAHEFRA